MFKLEPGQLKPMKAFFKNEAESLVTYLKRNWSSVFVSLAFGLFLFWILTTYDPTTKGWVSRVLVHKPSLWLALVFEWLLLLALYTKLVSLWCYYRNSYFVKGTPLFWIDGLLFALLPPSYWLTQQAFSKNDYFFYTGGSLALFLLGTYIRALITSIRNRLVRENLENDKFSEKTFLFSDEPIDENDADLIGRGNFARALKENIYNLSFRESFVMALYGRWGEGKTSILNLLKRDVREENRMLIYEFDPWFYGDENALTTNFYRGLEDVLQESYFIPRKVKKLLKVYPEVLIKGFTNISVDFHNKSDEDRPIELKKEIESFVAGLDKRVLVIIDDIDRLQKDEILAVFRLIKLTSHIKNLVFLISFDAARVVDVLKDKENFKDPQRYIEKIVQLPINLPMTDPSKVDQFLLFSFPAIGHKSEIDKLFDRLELDKTKRDEFDKEFVKIYQSDLRQIFSTYRAAKRYLNSILFRLPFIEREVNLYDFFIVEVIQTFYPELYADMKSSPWYYLPHKWSFETIALSPLPYDDTQRRAVIKAHFEELLKNMPYKDAVQSMLESIFPELTSVFSTRSTHTDSGSARINKRITHPECYPKYFMLGTRERLISDAEFEDLLKQWSESVSSETEIEKSFFEKYQKEFKLVELFERLKLHSASLSSNLVLPLIRVLYKNSKRLQRDGELWMTEFDQADGVIFRLIEDRKDVIKNAEIQPLLKEIVENAPGLDLAALVVLTCNEGRSSTLNRVRENVNVEELRNTLEERFSQYFIEGEKDIFEEYPKEREFAFILYQWATNWGSDSTSTRGKVSKYLTDLFKENPPTAGFFLRHYVKDGRFFDEPKYFDYQGLTAGYDANMFKACLAELGDKAFSTESEKEAINLFLKKHIEATTPAASASQVPPEITT